MVTLSWHAVKKVAADVRKLTSFGAEESVREGEKKTNRSHAAAPLPFSISIRTTEPAAGILPAVEPGILPGGMGEWFEKTLALRTAGPGGKMPPSTAAKMAAATDVNPGLNTYRRGEEKASIRQ